MTSPQENYTYEQLVKYYETAKKALANYNKQYPDLHIDVLQADQDVLLTLHGIVQSYGDDFLAKNAYLEDDEKDGIEVGTRVHHTKQAKRKKLLGRIKREKDLFTKDLTELIDSHKIHLKGMYLELSHMSAKFTADRIQELVRRQEWVETQEKYLINHYFKAVKQTARMKYVGVEFFKSVEALPESSGVYFIFKDGHLIYIGHSSNVKKRLSNHKLVPKSYRNSGPFELECLCSLMPVEEAKELEKDLIHIFKPEQNIQSKV